MLMLERGQRQTKVLNRLIGDLLDGTRIQAHKLNLSFADHDLMDIVQNAVEDQRQITQKRTIHLDLPANEAILVLADKDRIGQVISNYLSNALKYSALSEAITVGVRREEERARVWVQDNGPGLELEQQQRIWERYYQVAGMAAPGGKAWDWAWVCTSAKYLLTAMAVKLGLRARPEKARRSGLHSPLPKPLNTKMRILSALVTTSKARCNSKDGSMEHQYSIEPLPPLKVYKVIIQNNEPDTSLQ